MWTNAKPVTVSAARAAIGRQHPAASLPCGVNPSFILTYTCSRTRTLTGPANALSLNGGTTRSRPRPRTRC